MLLVISIFGLMLLGKADIIIVDKIRNLFVDLATPVLVVVSKPAVAISSFISNLRELASIRAENTKLRAENESLNLVKVEADRLAKENAYLSDLTRYIPPPKAKSISTRVIADVGNSFAQSLIAFVGHDQEVKKGNVVLTGDGLVGRVASVGFNSARIMLITDINSRVPVRIEHLDAPAILEGDNTEFPNLISLPSSAKVAVGDKVITSGMAGVYPPGLAVGIIVSNTDGIIKVRPFVNRNHLEIVHIVDFNLSGLIPEVPCETKE